MNPFLSQSEQINFLNNQNKKLEFEIKDNLNKIDEIKKLCNHTNKNGDSSFLKKYDMGEQKNYYECCLCLKIKK